MKLLLYSLIFLTACSVAPVVPVEPVEPELEFGGTVSNILRPTANFTVQWTRSGCTSNFECIDEVVSDDDTTYVHIGGGNASMKDIIDFADTGLDASQIIESVTVHIIGRNNGLARGARFGISDGSSDDIFTNVTQSATYTDNTKTYTTDPFLGGAITAGEVDGWKIGFKKSGIAQQGGTYRITQAWVEISFADNPEVKIKAGRIKIKNGILKIKAIE